MGWIFFNLPNPSSRTMALGSTQHLIEIYQEVPGIFLGGGRPALKADNLTAICADFLETVGACYKDSFTFIFTCRLLLIVLKLRLKPLCSISLKVMEVHQIQQDVGLFDSSALLQ
jgi:hypothetical protein